MVGSAAGGKDLGPAVLGVAQHQRNKPPGGIVWRPGSNGWRRARLFRGRSAAEQDLRAIEKYARIHTEIPADQTDNDNSSDAKAAPASGHAAGSAGLAIVFDIAAGTEIICAHLSFSNRVPLELQAAAQHYPSRRAAMKGYFCQKN
jgi:hypothetical protein